ncbi:acyltransferase [Sphingomonas sp. AR_OL41]|uniref:acyltransferase family protein n=1 Tax=Sphingomonas sp. AR_OL41 TaxID=3042729 RepID=UPI0024812ED3|nr:acyltransferase [Sphingomonas sp. AR_OL41]MDH7974446.1 acyltransferase [Sphingomonas sp. AR_OL41]
MGYALATLADSRRNNLRVVRLVAATAVIFAHSYGLNFGLAAERHEPLAALTGIDSGSLAVDVFFVASGFLVGRSLLRGRDPIDFLLSRALRIYPALICAVLAMAFLLGPTVTTLSLRDYFHDQWLYRFLLFDTTMLSPGRFVAGLPGVFKDLPYRPFVAGSLWTLPWELWMYGILLGLFLARGFGRAYPILLGILAVAFAAIELHLWQAGIFLTPLISFLALFHAGVCAYRYRDNIILSWPIFASLSLAMIVVNVATQSPLLLPIWLAYAVLFVSYYPPLVIERWCDGPDYSYGIYIYAYAVQQTLIWRFGPMPDLPHFLLAWGLTMPFAIVSWHLIEKPALGLKERLRRRRHVPPAVVEATV